MLYARRIVGTVEPDDDLIVVSYNDGLSVLQAEYKKATSLEWFQPALKPAGLRITRCGSVPCDDVLKSCA